MAAAARDVTVQSPSPASSDGLGGYGKKPFVMLPPAATGKLTVPTLGYTIEYANRLVRTGKNYSDSNAGLPAGARMSTFGEELAIKDAWAFPRATALDDLFGMNESKWTARQWTATGLRVPAGYSAQKFETDGNGDKYWPRIVLLGNREVGEVFVPEGHGRIVPASAWDDVFGIPRKTYESSLPAEQGGLETDGGYVMSGVRLAGPKCIQPLTRFWFNPEVADIAVTCKGYRCPITKAHCWYIDASKSRSETHPDAGIRPVREAYSQPGGSTVQPDDTATVQTRAKRVPRTLPDRLPPPPSVLTESAREFLRQTESSSEKLRRQLLERPIDRLLQQMREPPKWQPPYG